MKRLLIVKSKSRLGLINSPFGGDSDKNIGVETGPEAIVSGLGLLKNRETIALEFPTPEESSVATYLSDYAKLLGRGQAEILTKISGKELLINFGGDHSVAFMSLAAILKHKGSENVGYIQIDSHTDVHSLDSSPSGNFHGMWMRPFLDNIGEPAIDSLVPTKLHPEKVMYMGNLNCEPAEEEFLNKHNILRISRSEIATNKERILAFVKDSHHLHLSIDVDAFDKTIAPGTGIKAENGLFWEDVEFLLNRVHSHASVSVDIVEYNPKKDLNGITLELISKIVSALL